MAPKQLSNEWQLQCMGVKSRGEQLLQSELWADCWFVVGAARRRQAAHRLLLAAASPALEGMLYGALAGNTDNIPVPHVEPDAFYVMLEYIYTDNVNIGSCNIAREVYFAAHKYTLPHLKKVCIAYLCNHLDPMNVCKTYELAQQYREETLINECQKIMKEKTMEVLEASGFLDAKEETVTQLFMLEPLEIDSEMQLFAAAERYVLERDRRTSIEDDDNMFVGRSVKPLRSAVQQIRFLTLTLQEFSGHPTLEALLTETEIMAIVKNLTTRDSVVPMPSGFSYKKTLRNKVESRPQVTTRIVADITSPSSSWFTQDVFKMYSSPFYCRNLPWCLHMQRDGAWLSVHVICNWEVNSGWLCQAEVELNLISYTRPDITPFYWKFNRLFSPADNEWGCFHFIRWNTLVDPVNGYVQDNKITIDVRIRAE